jgi:hypothetical protein
MMIRMHRFMMYRVMDRMVTRATMMHRVMDLMMILGHREPRHRKENKPNQQEFLHNVFFIVRRISVMDANRMPDSHLSFLPPTCLQHSINQPAIIYPSNHSPRPQ